MAPKLIVFDWDGTLADSAGMIVSALQQAFSSLGLDEPKAGDIRQIIGLNLAEAIAHLAAGAERQVLAQLETEYRRAFGLQRAKTRLFCGAIDVLEHFHSRGVTLAVATGKSFNGLRQALDESGTGKYFSSLRTADNCASKPSPEMLEEILLETGNLKQHAVMVGDTSFDLEMARNAGVAAVAACYGAHERSALATYSPRYFIESIGELAERLSTNQ